MDKPRLFCLNRTIDETGISGTGVVAWGVEFPDGRVVTRWAAGSPHRQTCVWDSLEAVKAIHGHNGMTQIIFL